MADIIFVTYKRREDVETAVRDVLEHAQGCRLIFTGLPAAASVNRNHGLAQVESDIVIMMDDDLAGFYPGWTDDLIAPLLAAPDVLLASARLLNPDGSPGPCIGSHGLPHEGVVVARQFTPDRWYRLPTACIAFRKSAASIRFDEGFVGSGYEDIDWMNRLNIAFPGAKMVLNNSCKLIHYNRETRQGGKYFDHNKNYYVSKWPADHSVRDDTDWTVTKGYD